MIEDLLNTGTYDLIITADETDDTVYYYKEVTGGLVIAKAEQSISYDTTSVSKTMGEAAFTNPLTESLVYGMISYSSSDISVATVDSSTGEVTLVGVGTATITAYVSGDGANYTEATATYTLTVSLAAGEYSDNIVGDIEGVTADIPVEQLLTDSDKSLIVQGYDVEFVLSLYDYNEDVSAADVTKITEEAGSGLLSVFYMDINLTKYIYQPDGTLDSTNALKDLLAAAVSITVPIPDSMLEEAGTTSGTYYVIRLHDGEAETLEVEYDSENQTATFETDRFSTYALVFIKTDTKETTTTTTNATATTTSTSSTTTTTSAQTGDTNPVIPLAGTCTAALVLIAALIVVHRRRHV